MKPYLGRQLVWLLLLMVAEPALAQLNLIEQPDYGQFNPKNTFSNQSILPVDEAYKVNLSQDSSQDGSVILMQWRMPPEYYLYRRAFKYLVDGIEIKGESLTKGIVKYDDYFEKDLEVFYNRVDNRLKLTSAARLLTLGFQGCTDQGFCFPPETYYFSINPDSGEIAKLTANQAQVALEALKQPDLTTPLNATHFSSWLWALLTAFLGGVILNFMPCVFPILSIKVLSLVNHKAGARQQGFIYTLGVLFSFMMIASILLILRASGSGLGWGFQLQSSLFVSFLFMLFLVMGLSLYGVTQFGTRLMGVGQELTEGSGAKGAFFSGLLAVLVATPCTAPFMASALGYAVIQPPAVALSVFIALGCGMASPLLLLTCFPSLAARLPAPGKWMLQLKQLLAFPLFFTCIWLLWVYARQLSIEAAVLLLCAALSVLISFWLRNQWRGFYFVIALVAALWFWVQAETSTERLKVDSFQIEELDQLIGGARPVFVNVTADWCITCLVNKKSSLDRAEVINAFEQARVHWITADWSRPNDDIGRLLNRYHRVGIPLYLWFPAHSKKPVILPQLLTPALLLKLVKTEE